MNAPSWRTSPVLLGEERLRNVYAVNSECTHQVPPRGSNQDMSPMSCPRSLNAQPLTPARLRPGDRVRIVSPSSPPERTSVERGAKILEGWGLRVEFGLHAFDKHGHFLAGRDEDRLADLNDALRDPGVRAIFTTRGGKGAYRIAHALDFEACVKDPKPLVGFSDTTSLHLALWHECRLAGFHGPYIAEDRYFFPRDSALHLRRALMEPESQV
jgi:muramoyltetrapeptide carboxypeptidase